MIPYFSISKTAQNQETATQKLRVYARSFSVKQRTSPKMNDLCAYRLNFNRYDSTRKNIRTGSMEEVQLQSNSSNEYSRAVQFNYYTDLGSYQLRQDSLRNWKGNMTVDADRILKDFRQAIYKNFDVVIGSGHPREASKVEHLSLGNTKFDINWQTQPLDVHEVLSKDPEQRNAYWWPAPYGIGEFKLLETTIDSARDRVYQEPDHWMSTPVKESTIKFSVQKFLIRVQQDDRTRTSDDGFYNLVAHISATRYPWALEFDYPCFSLQELSPAYASQHLFFPINRTSFLSVFIDGHSG